MNINSFKSAFATNRGSCRGFCECGKEFYNSDGGWSWEDGELEKLDKDPNATDMDCTVGFIVFHDKEFVYQCNCWQDRAKRMMEFIDSHSFSIAQYLNLERKRKMKEAENMPTVET